MKNVRFLFPVGLLLLFLSGISRAGIVVDYSHDSFFATHATAKASLEAAVSDINSVLNLNLSAIVNDVTVGTSGGGSTHLDFNFNYAYTNPTTGASVSIADTTLPANEIRLFVGMRNLTGSTLGQGGPGGSGFGLSGAIGGGSVADAIADAEANHQHRRGDGPTISTFTGSVAGEQYTLSVGSTVSNLWFDSDTNNDGSFDTDTLLEDNWHFDHTTGVASGKSDFYSVALHEVLHSIGVGTSESWNDLVVSGTDWTGAEVNALTGSGTGIISGGHFDFGLMSTRITDGMAQEVVMDPNITVGTRKYLTAIDVAALRDIGFVNAAVTAVPEPSTFLAMGLFATGAWVRRRKK